MKGKFDPLQLNILVVYMAPAKYAFKSPYYFFLKFFFSFPKVFIEIIPEYS